MIRNLDWYLPGFPDYIVKLRDWVKTNYTDPPRDETTPEWIEQQRQEVAERAKTAAVPRDLPPRPGTKAFYDWIRSGVRLGHQAAVKAVHNVKSKDTPLERLAKDAQPNIPVQKGKRPPQVKPPQPPASQDQKPPKSKPMPPKQILVRGSKKSKAQVQRFTSVPVALGTVSRGGGQARIRNVGRDKVIISRREFIREVSGSASAALALVIIPITPASFPWSSKMDILYESYRFRRCQFEFVPFCASSTAGDIILAPDYDPNDTHVAADGAGAFLAMKDSVDTQSWKPLVCRCDPLDLNKRKTLFTGIADPAVLNDKRLHYAGNLHVVTASQGATTAIGRLWVDYEIEYETPQLTNTKSGMNETGDIARFVGASNAAFFGAGPGATEGSIPAVMTSSGTTTSVTTWTFFHFWSGYCVVNITGTISAITPSGTGDEAEIWEDATSLQWFGWVDCDPGETFILTIGNSAYTDATAFFIRGSDVRA